MKKLQKDDDKEQMAGPEVNISETIAKNEYATEQNNMAARDDEASADNNEEIIATEEDNTDTADITAVNDDTEALPDETKTENTAIPDVDELYSNIIEYYEAPESISLIPGVNPAIVRDIQLIDRRFFHNMDISEETVKNNQDIMEFIGEYGMPYVYAPAGWPRDLSATCGSYSNLIRFKNAEVFKFVYSGGTFDTEEYGDYNACILPDELCEGIDGNSTLDDFIKILGSDPKPVIMRNPKTEMSTADNETGYLFKMKNLDAVTVFFDDNGKLCDYIYLFIAEGGGRAELVKTQD